MQFKSKTEKEIQEAQLAPAGEYPFTVIFAEDAKSKNGNDMIKVKLGVYNGDAIRWHVTDYLMEKMEAKLRHFCEAVGLLPRYEQGCLQASDCLQRSGMVKLVIKSDSNGQFPDKNEVRDYVVERKQQATPKAEKPKQVNEKPAFDPNDDVPF